MARPKGIRNGDGKPFKRGNAYYAAISVGGKQIKRKLEATNYRDAVKERSALLKAELAKAEKVKPVGTRIPIIGAFEKFNKLANTLTKNRLADHKRQWESFEKAATSRGIKYLDEIDKPTVLAFLKTKGEGHTVNYVSQAKGACRKIFTALAGENLRNPFDGIPKRAGATRNETRFGMLTDNEVESLLVAAEGFGYGKKEEWSMLFRIASETGLRRKDICKLRWSSINFEKEQIFLVPAKTKGKTGAAVCIPLFNPLLSDLRKLANGGKEIKTIEELLDVPVKPAGFVLPNMAAYYDSEPFGGAVARDTDKIFRKAHVEKGVYTDEDGLQYKKSFHSFRVRFASLLASAGCPFPVATSIMGHSAVMFLHYFRRNEELSREFVGKALGKTEEKRKHESAGPWSFLANARGR